MTKRKTKGSIYREIQRLEDWKSYLVFRNIITNGSYWHSARFMGKKDYCTGYLRKLEEKFNEEYQKKHEGDKKAMWNRYSVVSEHMRQIRVKLPNFIELINKTEKKINRLKTKKYNLVGKKKKQNVGRNLAEMVSKVSREELAGMRFCSPTGREVKISFKMYKAEIEERTRGWYYISFNVKEANPKTPAEIAIYRMKGYVFDAELDKYTNAMQRVYEPTTQNKGVFYYADKYPQNSDAVDRANKYRKKIKDTLYAKYMDSHKKHRYSLKFKDIYLYETDSKWIDKKQLKFEKEVNRIVEALPRTDFVNENSWTLSGIISDLVKHNVKVRNKKDGHKLDIIINKKIEKIRAEEEKKRANANN